uniref:U-box domain-containing protein n=3 Tax=Setaria TaxID=4554 RepID=K3ZR53_SETIT
MPGTGRAPPFESTRGHEACKASTTAAHNPGGTATPCLQKSAKCRGTPPLFPVGKKERGARISPAVRTPIQIQCNPNRCDRLERTSVRPMRRTLPPEPRARVRGGSLAGIVARRFVSLAAGASKRKSDSLLARSPFPSSPRTHSTHDGPRRPRPAATKSHPAVVIHPALASRSVPPRECSLVCCGARGLCCARQQTCTQQHRRRAQRIRVYTHQYSAQPPPLPLLPTFPPSSSLATSLPARRAMVSLAGSQIPSPSPGQSPCAAAGPQRRPGRSMRTIRSALLQPDSAPGSPAPRHGDGDAGDSDIENLTDSVIDFHLSELAATAGPAHPAAVAKSSSAINAAATELLELSRDFSDYSSFSSDISGELERLAMAAAAWAPRSDAPAAAVDLNDLESMDLSPDAAPLERVEPFVLACVQALGPDAAPDARRAAAARIRLLAKHRSDIRELIGVSGAIPALVPLLRSTDPVAQENAVTALLNLSLEERNRSAITAAGAIKPLVYALRTGTAAAKQNAACALLSLSGIEENRATIGACGAIPPLVALLSAGSTRGKKDALTTLYRLCSARRNKERAVSAGAIVPLVHLIGERGSGTCEKAMVVLGSLAGIAEGREAVVEAGGIPALVEAIEDGPAKEKEFAVVALLQLCSDSPHNRALLVREGAIPPLVALSQSGSARAKHKAETLLGYLREQRQGVGCRAGSVAATSLAR